MQRKVLNPEIISHFRQDGSSLKGKTLEWTYDRDNNVFTSSKGSKYIRPIESIEGKLTLA